ncbi:MAG TPA: enoyl-CoA hydratase-related protein [Iamia sp.]|nr:enoyl-CoA hydratase-related protein [Iamia sp.]
MTGADHDLVRVEVGDDGVAVLTLADPDRRNALRLEMTRALAAAVGTALAAEVGAIVLTADPPVFCSGGSLDDLLAPRAPLEESYVGMLALAEAPVVTIAAVGGAAIGAGVNLPLACDVVVASPAARFDPRWLDVGIHPGGGHLWRLERRVGRQAAAALVLCGERVDGRQAERIGLAWRCVDTDDELLPEAHRLAARAAARDRALVQRTKATLRATVDQPDVTSALDLELQAQQWSMAQPHFHETLARLRPR